MRLFTVDELLYRAVMLSVKLFEFWQNSCHLFSRTWDHHDVLHVEPEYNGTSRCSTSARLVSIAPYSGRKETAVYAADVNSGTVLRCEVFIDSISRIQIFHHSVKLDLDGLATLQIRAFDSEGTYLSSNWLTDVFFS